MRRRMMFNKSIAKTIGNCILWKYKSLKFEPSELLTPAYFSTRHWNSIINVKKLRKYLTDILSIFWAIALCCYDQRSAHYKNWWDRWPSRKKRNWSVFLIWSNCADPWSQNLFLLNWTIEWQTLWLNTGCHVLTSIFNSGVR